MLQIEVLTDDRSETVREIFIPSNSVLTFACIQIYNIQRTTAFISDKNLESCFTSETTAPAVSRCTSPKLCSKISIPKSANVDHSPTFLLNDTNPFRSAKFLEELGSVTAAPEPINYLSPDSDRSSDDNNNETETQMINDCRNETSKIPSIDNVPCDKSMSDKRCPGAHPKCAAHSRLLEIGSTIGVVPTFVNNLGEFYVNLVSEIPQINALQTELNRADIQLRSVSPVAPNQLVLARCKDDDLIYRAQVHGIYSMNTVLVRMDSISLARGKPFFQHSEW